MRFEIRGKVTPKRDDDYDVSLCECVQISIGGSRVNGGANVQREGRQARGGISGYDGSQRKRRVVLKSGGAFKLAGLSGAR